MRKVIVLFLVIALSAAAYGQQECFRADRINTALSFVNRNQVKDVYFWQSCYGANALRTKLRINSYSAEGCGNNLYTLKVAGTMPNGQSISGRVSVNDLYIPNGRFAISLGTMMGIQTSPCVAQIDLTTLPASENTSQSTASKVEQQREEQLRQQQLAQQRQEQLRQQQLEQQRQEQLRQQQLAQQRQEQLRQQQLEQ